MKWRTKYGPNNGERRVQKTFALFPAELDDGYTVWLESYWEEIEWCEYRYDSIASGWHTVKTWSKNTNKDKKMFKTEWTHQPVSLTDEQQQLLNRQIAHISDDLDKASDLIFHTVFLTKDMKGAIVIVDGRDGVDDTLYLTYYENPSWTTLADMEDADDVEQEMSEEWKLDNN